MAFSASEQIVHSTYQIFQLDDQKRVVGLATGFVMAFCVTDENYVPALVSNRHVLCKCSSIKLVFTLRKPDGTPSFGETLDVIISTAGCIPHPNDQIDLAVLPLGSTINELRQEGKVPLCACMSVDLIPNKDTWDHFDAIEQVITAGFPGGLRDAANNLPILRSGITASHPRFDFQGRPEFLVDMPCFKGCSGSPVFLFENIIAFDEANGGKPVNKKHLFLLGVQYAIPTAKASSVVSDTASASATVELPLNLGYIIKSSELLVFEPLLLSAGTQ